MRNKHEKKLSSKTFQFDSFSQNERLVYKDIFGESMDANVKPMLEYKLSIINTTHEINQMNTANEINKISPPNKPTIDQDDTINVSALTKRKQ